MAEAKDGVAGRPKVGLETRFADPPLYWETGRARRDGERPPGGTGVVERGGGPDPVNFL